MTTYSTFLPPGTAGTVAPMRRREREGSSGAAVELDALLAAGDHRLAAIRARAVLADAAAPARDRERARAALARTAPDARAALVVLSCLAWFAVVVILGLSLRP